MLQTNASRTAPSPERYYLDTGSAGAERLRLLHSIYGPETETALRRAGLRPGMRVADIGCGIGLVSRHLADAVGSTGHVTAVDASAAQLAIARTTLADATASVGFVEASAYATTLPHASFDLVYCRFLLCHLQRPRDAIDEFRALLRPGGVLVCEDMEASTIGTLPPTSIYSRLPALMRTASERRGTDFDIGARLPALLNERAFADVQVRLWQPAYFEGDEKRFWEYSTIEAAPHLADAGFVSREEMQARVDEMREVNNDPDSLLHLPRVWQVWAVKP